MNGNKLVVISMDALVQQDLELMKNMPAFKYLLENGSYVKDFRSIYPTLTYPCHTTMSTGCYPNKHGITGNEEIIEEPGKDPYLKWMHYHEKVKCEDIIDVCKKAGLSTSIIGWPVSGCHKNADYLVDEAWPENKADYGNPEAWKEAYLKTGTPQWLYDEVVADKLYMRVGKKQPASSYFLVRVAADIIRKYAPDIMIIHVGNVDSFRHSSGVFSEAVKRTLCDTDAMMTMLFDAARDAGIFDKMNFVVTSDHGQITTSRNILPNVFLKEHGLIETDNNGNLKSWKAICLPTGMSAQIHVKDKADVPKVYSLLKEAEKSGLHGFEKVYTKEEILKSEGLGGDFDFILETDNVSHFGFGWRGAESTAYPMGFYEVEKGAHGFHPDKGPRPVFIACGPDIEKGKVIEHARLVDGAPTYAEIMGVQLKNADGAAIDILRKQRG